MQLHRKALVIKLGQIGDAIMAIPAVYALHLQGYDIEWVCGKAVEPLLACYSWIRTIPVEDKTLFLGGAAQKVRVLMDLWRRIVPQPYDLCATLYYDTRYRLLTFPVRCRRRVTLSQRTRSTTLLPSRHPADEFTRVLLGTEDGCREHSSAPVRPDRLPPSPLPAARDVRRIAMFAGGVQHLVREQVQRRLPEQALRRWPVERFGAVAEELCKKGWEVVLMGSPEDVWVRPHFAHLRVTDCIGAFSLPEVVSACNNCDAVITHDTGPLHLAGLSDTCLVSIFGPTDPSTRVPRRPGVVGIWGGQGFACRPCYDGRDFAPCQFNGCMHQVPPDLVLRELDRLLNARSEGTHVPWHITCPEST